MVDSRRRHLRAAQSRPIAAVQTFVMADNRNGQVNGAPDEMA